MPTSVIIRSACLQGLDVIPFEVVCSAGAGRVSVGLVGPDLSGVQEALFCCEGAIEACDFEVPRGDVMLSARTRPSCSPDAPIGLALAAAMLAATGQIPAPPETALLVGDVAIDGGVLPTRGLPCYDSYCEQRGLTLVCARGDDRVAHVPLVTIGDLREPDWSPRARVRLSPAAVCQRALPDALVAPFGACLGANRVLLLRGDDDAVASAVGALSHALPALDQEQCDELALVYSACDSERFQGEPPFRAPRHSCTLVGMLGGGRLAVPGEVTLASHGLLLLSDVGRYGSGMLNCLRAALEMRSVRIARTHGVWSMPAAPALTVATTRDTTNPPEKVLRSLSSLGFAEVAL